MATTSSQKDAQKNKSTRSCSVTPAVNITWNILAPLGPTVSHHVGVIIGNYLYIHGGIEKKGSTKPLNSIYRLDISQKNSVWETIRAANSPSLSHHATVVLEDRYLVTVGGWNGQKRCTDMWAYDSIEDKWISLKTSGFPVGGGLSSHTVTKLKSNKLLIIGREGSLRIQRRTGNAYLLTGCVHSGSFVYSECPQEVASRSGHTTHGVGKDLFIYGGRSDNSIEAHGNVNPVINSSPVMSDLIKMTGRVPALRKIPSSRKNHAAISAHGAVLIHGGETFDGRSREPVVDTFLLLLVPAVQWYHLDSTSGMGRAGHVMCQHGNIIIIHGGEGAKGSIRGETYTLNLSQ